MATKAYVNTLTLGAPAVSQYDRFLVRPEALDNARRGYRPGRPAVRAVLGPHARAFLGGYNATLAAEDPEAALAQLDPAPAERGFAVEGAAMAAVLIDLASESGGRLVGRLLELEGVRYLHLIHFGAGFALSRLERSGWAGLEALDPLLRWLAFDGAGFSVAAFGDDARVRALAAHDFPCTAECAVRHQGVGRALWFIESAEPGPIAERIAGFPEQHRGDLWSGVGFAATLAGGGPAEDVERLPGLAGEHRPQLAQGAAFAAEVAVLAGEHGPDAERSVRILADASVEQAGAWSAEARSGLDGPGAGIGNHQLWRERLAVATGVGSVTP